MNYQKGQAAILLVFILSMFSLLIGLTMVENGFTASILGRKPAAADKALYAAYAGIEDAAYQISALRPNLGNGTTDSYEYDVSSDAHVKVTITGDDENRTITAVGTSGPYVKKAVSKQQYTSVLPGFNYAVHANKEFELEVNSTIKGKGTAPGNVYTNASIKGKNKGNSTCTGGSPSLIKGNLWAVTIVDQLTPGDGVCVTGNAFANNFNNCNIVGKRNSPNSPAGTCLGGAWVNTPAPTPIPLPDMHIDQLKTYMTQKAGSTVRETVGSCTADLSGGVNDCTLGDIHFGNVIVNGDLTINIPTSKTLFINGPIWVKGKLTIRSNSKVSVDPLSTISQIFLVDKTITSESNVTFGSYGNIFLLFISADDYLNPPAPTPTPAPTADLCTSPAITISSNTNSVLFYATKGCALITQNSSFYGAVVGEKISVSKNASIEYDPNLALAVFGWTDEGGWQTLSYSVD
jgi:hypothetical protein